MVWANLLQRVLRRSREAGILVLAGIASLSVACEVQWGGASVQVREPEFEREERPAPPADVEVEAAPPEMPKGRVFFHVTRLNASGQATIEPVAELAAGELEAVGPRRAENAAAYAASFNARYYEVDQPYHLYRGSGRVGTFYVRAAAATGSGLCLELRAVGLLELRPAADTLSEFLAWSPGARIGTDSLAMPGYREDMQVLSQVLARRGLTERALPGDWRIGAPTDLRPIQVGSGPLGFAATFMIRDSLKAGRPPGSAGSVFLVADYTPARGFFPLYFDAAWYAPGQKRGLRWLDATDLLGDPTDEWIVRAYGDTGVWYEVLAREGNRVTVQWSGRRPVCEVRGAPQ
jgi:hypothetical protein